jgi:microcin C transport system substrate-binding protein
MKIMRMLLFVILSFALVNQALAGHGISIDGLLKYPPGFSHFDYTSEKAVKGGKLVLHGLGSFDKMNPFTLKGIAPDGLQFFVFETLTAPSLDEPFAAYGLIARDIELASDGLSVVFTLNEKARFSSGEQIRAEDVEFSLEIFKTKAHPRYQAYYKDIIRAEIMEPDKIRFHFSRKNRELHMIVGQIPILSKKFYSAHSFGSKSMIPPVGSGPYIVDSFKLGKSIVYKRNPDYWARDLNVRKGMFNFDRVSYFYYKDQIVSVQAFLAHEFDFYSVNVAKQWARDLTGKKFTQKLIIKEYLEHKNNQGMQGFVFNTRKGFFKDPRVRKAISLALDFEWINKTLFFDQYTRSNSYFSNSNLAATGIPEGGELSLLQPFNEQLSPEVFTKSLTPASTHPPSSLRKNLRAAKKILNEAGWRIKKGALVNKDGKSLEFEILLAAPMFGRVVEPYIKNLQKLGVKATHRIIDPTIYIQRMQRFEFDMMVNVFGQSQSPGNEQRNYWHSSYANQVGSRNLAGVNSPVVDHLVDKIIYARTQDELNNACKALDRVLWYGYYVVPNWYLARHRVAYWNKFSHPDTLPVYYSPIESLMTWWVK